MTTFTVRDDPAQYLAEALRDRLADGREKHLALAGGSTPRRAYELLATLHNLENAMLWLGDERCVAADHPDANARMVEETLGATRATFVPPRGELGPEDAAWLYARDLGDTLGDDPVFDVVVLGLGEDGHTASLFPGHLEVLSKHAPVIPVRGAPKPPPERITITLPVIARARYTVLLATGAGKRDALARVRARDKTLPPGLLGDAIDEIVCDEAAASA